jgi:fibronectin type 3 domain-containing protein
VATEEPGVNLTAPASLVATTMSNLQPSRVQVSWSATTGAEHYEVERTINVNTPYTQVSSNVVGTTFTDTTVSSVTAYLYRVRAVGPGGSVSPYSNIDLATAISFTDDTLQVGSTPIKAEHFNQLRQAVNAARATTSNLAPANWAETITANSTTIRASHVTELRNKLDEARSSLDLTTCSCTAATIGVVIQKVHIDQLRTCVR